MAAQFDAMVELQGAFKLLFERKNWMLAVPILVSLLVCGVAIAIGVFVAFGSLLAGGGLAGAMAGSSSDARGPLAMFGMVFSGLGLLFIIFVLVGIVVALFGYAWAYGAAEPMWQGGDPDIGGGFSKALSKLGSIIVLGLIVGIVELLFFWTVIVPLAIALFCCYAIPYVMQGNQSGWGAITSSINLAKNNLGPTAMLFLAVVVVSIVAGIVNAILGMIPLLGQLVAIAVGSLAGAYFILVLMRFYNLLTGAAAPPPAATTPTA